MNWQVIKIEPAASAVGALQMLVACPRCGARQWVGEAEHDGAREIKCRECRFRQRKELG